MDWQIDTEKYEERKSFSAQLGYVIYLREESSQEEHIYTLCVVLMAEFRLRQYVSHIDYYVIFLSLHLLTEKSLFGCIITFYILCISMKDFLSCHWVVSHFRKKASHTSREEICHCQGCCSYCIGDFIQCSLKFP